MGHRRANAETSPEPVIFVVDDDSATLRRIERDLERRFGRDYRIVTAPSPDAGIRTLERLAASRTPVAILCASLQMSAMRGTDFLERVAPSHRDARRILLVTMTRRGGYPRDGALADLQRSIALGRVEIIIPKGWHSPEEWFYPHIQQALSDWAGTHLPHKEVVRIVGDPWDPATHNLRDILDRNGVPSGFYAAETHQAHQLLELVAAEGKPLPVAIFQDGFSLSRPTHLDVANALEAQIRPDDMIYDLVILGGGPAGLAAAVYATSEGLSTLVVEPEAFGGHATDSSRIRNYLGFAEGVSGNRLAAGAYRQALLFGADFLAMQRATSITLVDGHFEIALSDSPPAVARSVVVAIGMQYRQLQLPALNRFVGAGVYYGSSMVEMPGMASKHVVVVGGGNSAGQAATHLSRYAETVTMLIRGTSLDRDMSSYLVEEIGETRNIEVMLQSQVTGAEGEHRLESLIVQHIPSGTERSLAASAAFLLIGTDSCAQWLQGSVEMDERGFIRTGRDLSMDSWPLSRAPHPFETSLPGVFAVGDVRSRSLKRVAGAVGEGSVAVGSVRHWLAEGREHLPATHV
ncbi:MAG: FAD-dependent oxidoreductase [Thermomicrobiales bacterium]